MSGLFGLFRFDGRPASRAELASMSAPLAHRGPDGDGVWLEGPAGLGHLALHVTAEARREVYPRAGAGGRYRLTADVCIDNREELLAALSVRDSHAPDGALLMAAFERWGERCPERLVGAYAFAIWDCQDRRLFLARDHYGLKPLYHARIGGRLFAFASEAKSILTLPEVPRTLDETTVAEHLCAPVASDATGTFYRHVQRLAPGTFLWVGERDMRHVRYWALDPSRELRLGSDEAYAEALRERFVEAVRCRLRSDRPVGAMLSGGLDSSSIVSVAAALQPAGSGRLRTYSAVFDRVAASDERLYIQSVLDRYRERVAPFFLPADSFSPLHDVDRVLTHLDGPAEAGNLYINWILHRQAQADGVRVILEGFDGDTTLSHGFGYLHELAAGRRWFTLFREIKAQTDRAGQPWQGAMWQWVKRYERIPGSAASVGWRLARRLRARRSAPTSKLPVSLPLRWDQVLNPAFRGRIDDHLQPALPAPANEREDHYRLLTRPLMHRVVEMLEASAAAAGLELGLPFCDRRLMEFCLSLPPEQKRHRGWNRIGMRRAMQGFLPPDIQWRDSKGDLGPSFDRGLLVLAGDRLRAMTERDTGGVGRFVDLDRLRAEEPALRQDRAASPTHFHWRALSLALWLQHTGL